MADELSQVVDYFSEDSTFSNLSGTAALRRRVSSVLTLPLSSCEDQENITTSFKYTETIYLLTVESMTSIGH